MTWSQLSELARHGWSIASHGCAHARLDRLTAAAIERELRRSKQVLEDRIGGAVSSFAYPYGAVPPAHVVAIEQEMVAAGYEYAVLAAGGAARTPPRHAYRVPRDPMAPGQRPAFAVQREGAATWHAS
jgi:peptidoglycan/xylan/chitin deacetylase (PgdA/CDA1 family)